jgi:hypothetical protein
LSAFLARSWACWKAARPISAFATDHVIESFRNDLWAGYKTGDGIEPELLSQFHPLEDALTAMGVKVWAMVEFEADDALAAAAHRAAQLPDVEQVIICTPDKDLSQCVVGERIGAVSTGASARLATKPESWHGFGVGPTSIPDYLALVGDSADGFPGIPGGAKRRAARCWGATSTSSRSRPAHRPGTCRSGARRGSRARSNRTASSPCCFRTLATLRTDVTVFADLDELRWRGPRAEFEQTAGRLGVPGLWDRARRAKPA